MRKDDPKDSLENDESEYIGNIWGWKFSFISLGIIVAMLLIMYLRYTFIQNQPPSIEKQTITIEKDSSDSKSKSID